MLIFFQIYVFIIQKGLLERLNNGEIVIGDGGFVFALEKRGYVKAGPWTPEAVIENPEAGRKKLSKLIISVKRIWLQQVASMKDSTGKVACVVNIKLIFMD